MRSRKEAHLGALALAAGGVLGIAPLHMLPLSAAASREITAQEYQVKAVFIYHFTRYLQWPQLDPSGSFEIAVLGDSAIVPPLQDIAARRTVSERLIVIRRIADLGSLGQPQILFLAAPASSHLPQVLAATRGKAILTIAEEEGLAVQGVAVSFVLREGAVKFEINEDALRETGIQPSSQLLKLAIPAGGGG